MRVKFLQVSYYIRIEKINCELQLELSMSVRSFVLFTGLPKSGKFWKTPKEKFRKIQNSLPKKKLAERNQYRAEITRIKQISKDIKEGKKQENELKKQRREENAKRREENELKSQTVQVS